MNQSAAAGNNSNGKSIIKSSSGVALATLLSRILGLLRVRLESAVLGGGAVASAWFLAFMIPNLFRRVLGEGALATALIPLIADIEAQEGLTAVRKKLAVVFAALGSVLALIVVVVSLASFLILHFCEPGFFQKDYIPLMLQLLLLLMPYAFFICLVGVVGAVVNYAGVFLLPALGALLLNIFLLGGLGAAWYFSMESCEFLPMLAVLVPCSGVVQLVLMLIILHRCGRFPLFEKASFADCSILRSLWDLALPGIISYSALQVSFIIDRALAASLGSQAVPALVYVDRLVDLPIGIFAVSLGGVLMASMTRAAAEGKVGEIAETLSFSLRLVWFVCVPLAALVIFFHEPMLRLLCLGGKYSAGDLDAARMVAVFYGSGIPLFCSLKVIYPAFHARKKMKLTLNVSLIAICCNIVLNIILMQSLKQGGIALATVISSWINNLILLFLLYREGFDLQLRTVVKALAQMVVISGITGGALFFGYSRFLKAWAERSYFNVFCALAVVGTTFVLFYLLLAYFCRLRECRELASELGKRFKRSGK